MQNMEVKLPLTSMHSILYTDLSSMLYESISSYGVYVVNSMTPFR
jgi:hypothetical protein